MSTPVRLIRVWFFLGAAGLPLAPVASAVTIDWMTVGGARNVADTQVMNDGTTGYGAVSYEYRIGKYEAGCRPS